MKYGWRLVWFSLACGAFAAPPKLYQPLPGLRPEQLAVVVNELDPQSREIGAYYQGRRQIPLANLIRVSFPPRKSLTLEEFAEIYREVQAKTPPYVQAYALAWTIPYRVACMSITTAFAAGFDPSFCAVGCKPTRASPYFNSEAAEPFSAYGWRPSMLLAGTSVEQVKRLIDRGVAADGTRPKGSAYLLKTSDQARSSRAAGFPQIAQVLGHFWPVYYLEQDALLGAQDVMFYFTGTTWVTGLETLRFHPGAIADHLTSSGGDLLGDKQMSILRWLEAGATASYGTAMEPCSFPQKFPHPAIVIEYYLRGNTLIEAYWKSVAWPGQGVFVGEPLARPFR